MAAAPPSKALDSLMPASPNNAIDSAAFSLAEPAALIASAARRAGSAHEGFLISDFGDVNVRPRGGLKGRGPERSDAPPCLVGGTNAKQQHLMLDTVPQKRGLSLQLQPGRQNFTTGGHPKERQMKKTLMLSALALMTGMLAVPSMADAAEARLSVNVRSGPGTSYRVVDRLQRGEDVNVTRCRSNGWCYITHPGPDGWVSAKYLVSNEDYDDYLGGRRVRPDVSFSIIIGGGGFGGGGGGAGGGPREELVCLATFFSADDVEAGADADVESARVLPRSEAEARDRPNDRRGVFDYGTDRQTIETCDYLDDLN